MATVRVPWVHGICTKPILFFSPSSRGAFRVNWDWSGSPSQCKKYSKVLIHRVVEITEVEIGETQCGFRKLRSYADQSFVVRHLCEIM